MKGSTVMPRGVRAAERSMALHESLVLGPANSHAPPASAASALDVDGRDWFSRPGDRKFRWLGGLEYISPDPLDGSLSGPAGEA